MPEGDDFLSSIINGINAYNYYNNFMTNAISKTSLAPAVTMTNLSLNRGLYYPENSKNYNPDFSNYFNTLTKNTSMLKTVASTLNNKNAANFNQKSIVSDSTAITGTAASRAIRQDYTVNVKSLATAQVDTGVKLTSSAQAANTGVNSIAINLASGESKTISYTVKADDTNKTALTRMADAINKGDMGITAAVTDDAKTGTSYITLTGETGAKNAFTIQDQKGSAVAAAGVAAASTTAQDGSVTVNGKAYTTSDNTLKLDLNRVTLKFTKAEGKDTKVTVGDDTTGVKDQIKSMIQGYNNLVQFANDNSKTNSGAGLLSSDLGKLVNGRKASLESIGITLNKDNTLTLDEQKLTNSLKNQPSRVKELISGSGGLADKLETKAKQVALNEYKYAGLTGISTTYSSGNTYFNSGSKLSLFQSQNLGYLFNTYA